MRIVIPDPHKKGKERSYYQCQFKIQGETYCFNAVNMKVDRIPLAMLVMRVASLRIQDDVKRREFFHTSFQFNFELEGEMNKEHIALLRFDGATGKWMGVSVGQGEYGELALKPLDDKEANFLGMSPEVPVPMDLSGKGALKGPRFWNWIRHRAALWAHTQLAGKVPEIEIKGVKLLPKIETYKVRAEKEAEMLKMLFKLDKGDLLKRIADSQLAAR